MLKKIILIFSLAVYFPVSVGAEANLLKKALPDQLASIPFPHKEEIEKSIEIVYGQFLAYELISYMLLPDEMVQKKYYLELSEEELDKVNGYLDPRRQQKDWKNIQDLVFQFLSTNTPPFLEKDVFKRGTPPKELHHSVVQFLRSFLKMEQVRKKTFPFEEVIDFAVNDKEIRLIREGKEEVVVPFDLFLTKFIDYLIPFLIDSHQTVLFAKQVALHLDKMEIRTFPSETKMKEVSEREQKWLTVSKLLKRYIREISPGYQADLRLTSETGSVEAEVAKWIDQALFGHNLIRQTATHFIFEDQSQKEFSVHKASLVYQILFEMTTNHIAQHYTKPYQVSTETLRDIAYHTQREIGHSVYLHPELVMMPSALPAAEHGLELKIRSNRLEFNLIQPSNRVKGEYDIVLIHEADIRPKFHRESFDSIDAYLTDFLKEAIQKLQRLSSDLYVASSSLHNGQMEALPLGIGLSFPLEKISPQEIYFTEKARKKGWFIQEPNITETELFSYFQNKFDILNLQEDINIQPMVILNNSTGSSFNQSVAQGFSIKKGLSGAAIVDNGLNLALKTPSYIIDPDTSEARLTGEYTFYTAEIGYLDMDPYQDLMTYGDLLTDSWSGNQGEAIFEKMISGKYIQRVIHYELKRLVEKGFLFNGNMPKNIIDESFEYEDIAKILLDHAAYRSFLEKHKTLIDLFGFNSTANFRVWSTEARADYELIYQVVYHATKRAIDLFAASLIGKIAAHDRYFQHQHKITLDSMFFNSELIRKMIYGSMQEIVGPDIPIQNVIEIVFQVNHDHIQKESNPQTEQKKRWERGRGAIGLIALSEKQKLRSKNDKAAIEIDWSRRAIMKNGNSLENRPTRLLSPEELAMLSV